MPWLWVLAGIAALLLAGWLYTRYQVTRASERQPPTGKIVTADGVRAHIVDEGQGQPVLFLHSLAGFLEALTWTPAFETLKETYRVIALDRPGYAHSTRPRDELSDPRVQADWLVALLDALDIQAPIVLGHSWGGGLAVTLAVRHLDRVAGLVLLAPYVTPRTTPGGWVHRIPRLLGLQRTLGHTLVAPIGRALSPAVVSASFEPEPIPSAYHEGWLDKVLRPSHFDTTMAEIRAIDPALNEVVPHLSTLDQPVTVVTGSEDASVDPERNAEPLVETLPDARLIWIEGAGHMLLWHHPDRVVEAVHSVAERIR